MPGLLIGLLLLGAGHSQPAAGKAGGPPSDLTRRLVASFLQVPEHVLELCSPDYVALPPSLFPPNGLIYRRWRVREDYVVSPRLPRPIKGEASLDGTEVSGTWDRPAAKHALRRSLSASEATRLANEFLRQRGKLAGLKLQACNVNGTDKGRVTIYGIHYLSPQAPWGPSASVWVDALYGYVHGADYRCTGQPRPTRPPVLSMAEARKLVEARFVQPPGAQLRITSASLTTRANGFKPGHPVYEFVFTGTRLSNGARVYVEEHWYVDGWDKRVGPAGDFPEVKRYRQQFDKWWREELPRQLLGSHRR